MSIPNLNRIRVLAKSSRPLHSPGPTSPGYRTRGYVVAIDGTDKQATKQIITALQETFSGHRVRLFEGPAAIPDEETTSFPDFLHTIQQYHELSKQVIDYITTPSSPSPVSPKTVPRKPMTRSEARASDSEAEEGRPDESPVPIALVSPWQLTVTDAYASCVPIDDSYAPEAHWQWMASSWRGVVGADVTIAVKDPSTDDAAGENGGKSGKERVPTVDVRLEEANSVVVKGERGGGVNEGALRRVGFEVGEWVSGLIGSRRRGS